MATVVIAADGNAERWGDHQPAKWLIDVDGERLIDRTIRQARQYSDNIVVIGNPDWNLDAPTFPTQAVTNSEADKLLCGRRFWDWHDTTIHLYGDVYYSDDAIETIFTTRPDPWHMFCRKDGSSLTGCGHGEVWAFSFTPSGHRELDRAIADVVEGYRTGLLSRPAGWSTYRALNSQPLRAHKLYNHYTIVDDWTEDFDKPQDFETWHDRWTHSRRPTQLSVSIMAHPDRKHLVANLLANLDRPASCAWDSTSDEWTTGMAAWQLHDPQATHHLVLQDDAIVTPDLIHHLERTIPNGSPLVYGLYVGHPKPQPRLVNRAVAKARAAQASWIQSRKLLWGVGVILPTRTIPSLIDYTAASEYTYDRRITHWMNANSLQVRYYWPSPIDHHSGPSLVSPRKGQRRAHEVQPLADFNPDGPVVTL